MSDRVLLVDDEANIRRMLGALLRSEDFEVTEAANGNAALEHLRRDDFDAVILDLMMPPGPDGLETLKSIREDVGDVPVIMMSGKAQLSDAVRATQLGAFQFLEKPLGPEAVLVTLRSALEMGRTRAENRALREALGPTEELIGESAPMRALREDIARVAPTDARVLVTGESGTGKELIAAAIHRASRRATGPFIPVNSAAVPKELVESEMFGHERGAFTGATARRLGRFELAHGGTLFLDEVGDLGADAQAKLLRVLESGEFTRVGGERPTKVDVRVIAATNCDLETESREGTFRQDLYFRLNVFPLAVRPLRERLEDLPLLVQHLSARIRPRRPQEFTPDALGELASHNWPGNVRELINIIERLAIMGADRVDAAAVRSVLPSERRGVKRLPADGMPPLPEALDDFERGLIARALATAEGSVAGAARLLKTDRANLYRRMRRLGLDR